MLHTFRKYLVAGSQAAAHIKQELTLMIGFVEKRLQPGVKVASVRAVAIFNPGRIISRYEISAD